MSPEDRQRWDPRQYARDAGFVAELGLPVVELLAPQPGERVLDLGCGDGALTEELARRGCRVVGVDASPEQIEAARGRGLDAHVVSGLALAFDAEFDAVFSNAALHWMKPPEAVIDGVFRALRPGGRFVAELGGHGCVARIADALIAGLERRGVDGHAHFPWYFPTDTEYAGRLEARGFAVREIALFPRPTPLPSDVRAWLEVFAQSFTSALPEPERPAYLDEVQEALRPALQSPDGTWTADYVRLRFAATRASLPVGCRS